MPRTKDNARAWNRTRFAPVAASLALVLGGAGVLTASAQDEKAAGREAPRPAAGTFDLAFVPNDAPLVIAFRPAALLKMPDLKALYAELTADEHVRRAVDVAEPESVEQIALVLLKRDIPLDGDLGEALAQAGAIVVKTNKAREWKALAAAGGLPLVKATHGGKDYYSIATGDSTPRFGLYQPDEKTLVVASETILHKLMDDDKADATRTPHLHRAVDGDGGSGTPIAVASVDFAWARGLIGPRINAQKEMALALSLIGPIWEKTNELIVSLSASDADGVTLTADHFCSDEEGTTRVMKTVEALLTLGRNVAPEALRLLREQGKDDPTAAEVAGLAEQALKSATIEQKGNRVRLKVAAKADIARFVREAVKK